jgi:hypothetical protein
MQTDKVINVLTKHIDDRILQLQESISSGNAENFDEYKRMCGVIQGLLTARMYMTDLNKAMENSDE